MGERKVNKCIPFIYLPAPPLWAPRWQYRCRWRTRSARFVPFVPRDHVMHILCLCSVYTRGEMNHLCCLLHRHLRLVDRNLWWVFPLPNGSRGSRQRGANIQSDAGVGGELVWVGANSRGGQSCQRCALSVVLKQSGGALELGLLLWLRIMEKNGNSTDWPNPRRSGLDVDSPRTFNPATDAGNFWIGTEVCGIFVIPDWRKNPGGLKSHRAPLKLSRG